MNSLSVSGMVVDVVEKKMFPGTVAKMELDQDQNFLVVTQGADRFDIPIVPLQ